LDLWTFKLLNLIVYILVFFMFQTITMQNIFLKIKKYDFDIHKS